MLRVQHNLFSITSQDKLLNKIDCSNVLKDRKIKAVHSPLEQQQALYLLAILSADCIKAQKRGRKSHEHEASANGDIIPRVHIA